MFDAERRIDQLLRGLAGPGRQGFRPQLFQGSQIRQRVHADPDRNRAGPHLRSDGPTIVAHRLTGPNGEFVGIITRTIVPATFEKYFASVVLREGAAISMYRRDGILLARYPHIEHMIGSNIRDSNVYAYMSLSSRRHPAPDQSDRRTETVGIGQFPATLPDLNRRKHDGRCGAGRLAGADPVLGPRGDLLRDRHCGDAVSFRSKAASATPDRKAAPRHRHQQHVAGPPALRFFRAARGLQPALYFDVRTVARRGEARSQLSRPPALSEEDRIVQRRRRGFYFQRPAQRRGRKDHPEHFRDRRRTPDPDRQSAAEKRLAGHPRGYYRAHARRRADPASGAL